MTKATVVIDGLFEWCQQNPVQEISRFEGNKWLGTEISATSDALEDIPLFSSDTATISLSPVVTNCGGSFRLKRCRSRATAISLFNSWASRQRSQRQSTGKLSL